VKLRTLERHQREHGAEVLDEGAKHTKWRGPAGGRTTVPRHHGIGFATAVAICKRLGIPRPPNPR